MSSTKRGYTVKEVIERLLDGVKHTPEAASCPVCAKPYDGVSLKVAMPEGGTFLVQIRRLET